LRTLFVKTKVTKMKQGKAHLVEVVVVLVVILIGMAISYAILDAHEPEGRWYVGVLLLGPIASTAVTVWVLMRMVERRTYASKMGCLAGEESGYQDCIRMEWLLTKRVTVHERYTKGGNLILISTTMDGDEKSDLRSKIDSEVAQQQGGEC